MRLSNPYVGGGLYGAVHKTRGLLYTGRAPAPPPSDTPPLEDATSGAGLTNQSKKALGLDPGARKRKRQIKIARPF